MKIQKFILMMLGVMLVACTPRVDDIFDETAVVRLEHRRQSLMEQLIDAPDGWAMQYFARVNPASSDTLQHRGYTFLMQFREDGTVTVGARIEGLFKTETSMWDIINDNSNVLTFNTFNSIFHYCSNPDPDMALWGADGEGIGGDYEFTVLEYNVEENYQLLKGKKQGCYIRMYPLKAGQDWENYLAQVEAMDAFLLAEDVPWELYQNDLHWTLYNARSHEFRAFSYGADTLGGGSYYGYITTPVGIYLNGGEFNLAVQHYQYDENGNKINESTTDTVINMPRDAFVLNAERTRLVAADLANTYITVEGMTALLSLIDHGKTFSADLNTLSAPITEGMETLENWLKNGVGKAKGNKNAKVLGFDWVAGQKANQIGLQINFSSNGTNNISNIFYLTRTVENGICTLKYEGEMGSQHVLANYNGEDFVRLFDGTYNAELVRGFTTSEGVLIRKTNDSNFSFTLR